MNAKSNNDNGAAERPGTGTTDVLDTETGGRHDLSGFPGYVLLLVPLAWSLFQIWYASPLPYIFDIGKLNSTEARSIHLAFAVFLSFTAFPALKRSPRDHIPVQDWVLALVGAFCAGYLALFYVELSGRVGAPNSTDVVVAAIGMILLLEATRRALGPPLMIIALVFLVYVFAGQYMPDVISHGGASLSRVASHMWLTTEGVFGVAIGVSASFVFLFVLFGAILERCGAGLYFIQMAFALLGHLRGGPAKAAVVSSGLTGIISGSSISNVVTTGTFTIPLMKRVGFPPVKAGAVEVAASTNGQLTPPVMGAAAFLIVEYVGIPYIDVMRHAILPALISYIGLFNIVHLEAVKAGMEGIPQRRRLSVLMRLLVFATTVIAIMVLSLAVYYGVGWTKAAFGDAAVWVVGAGVLIAYVALVALGARQPPLQDQGTQGEITELPEVGPTVKSGLYFLLPVAVLIWCLTVERFSPQLSVFWSLMFLIFIGLTHRQMLGYFRGRRSFGDTTRQGGRELFEGLISGARNMIGIGVATAAAGIVVGTVTLTGVGLVMTAFVEFISAGNFMLVLLFTAIICLLLGMGLPTTANYIVVATLMAPVIVELGQQAGYVVPLVAVHLFVFYFGILADDTPPVGLAAYAASAISGADPIRTGIQGFAYDIRTAILPFMFVFNTKLLLIGIDGPLDLIVTVVAAVTAMLAFAAATQGWWLTRCRWYEVAALLLIAFTFFRPGFWWDRFYPEFIDEAPAEVAQYAGEVPAGEDILLRFSGEDMDGNELNKTLSLPLGDSGDGSARLEQAGLFLEEDGGRVIVERIAFGSDAEESGIDFDWELQAVQVRNDRPPKELMYIPNVLLLGLVAWGQLRRRRAEEGGAVSGVPVRE